jgi:acyl-CoA thioesterase-2
MDDDALQRLLDLLDLEQIEVNMFRGQNSAPGFVFGGQVLGQALVAAARTVDTERLPHSLHSYFLRPGNGDIPILYDVDRIRDGRSFTTRRVVAIQKGRAIFNMSVSFQLREEGLEHQFDMPNVLGPEGLAGDAERFADLARRKPEFKDFHGGNRWPFDNRRVEFMLMDDHSTRPPYQHVWTRVEGDPGEDQVVHRALLAFASDMGFMSTATLPHGMHFGMQGASLDHSIWFHHDIRMDDWLLYQQESPSAAASRGFVRGSFYTREGLLVASTTQECLIRIRDEGRNRAHSAGEKGVGKD